MRAEEVRTKLTPDKWGPWASGGSCSRGTPGVFGFEDSRHPSGEPYFFHCPACIEIERRASPLPKPNVPRDLGLCVKCWKPAALDRKVVRLDIVACRQAEARGVTVARLNTRQHCSKCDPRDRPLCRGKLCNALVKAGGKRRRGTRDCFCYESWKKKLKTPHCLDCCRRLHENSPKGRVRLEKILDQSIQQKNGEILCTGPKCEESVAGGGRRRQALARGCCWRTKTTHKPHCAADCTLLADQERERNRRKGTGGGQRGGKQVPK